MRTLSVLVLSVWLAACGFHPRRELVVPPELGPVRVVTRNIYSPLGDGLARVLTRAGAQAASVDPDEKSATLRVLSEEYRSAPLSVDARARVQEFQTTYRVAFELTDAQGGVVVPRQTVELRREYTYDASAPIGTPAEEDVIREELERDMVAAIVRRLDIALRPDTP